MKKKEAIFIQELEVFRVEVESAAKFFYAYLSIDNALSKNERALELVNEAPLLWRTISKSLLTSFFITLGRIFDPKSNHTVNRVLRVAQEQCIIFSASALETRKRESSQNAEEYIDEYMKDVYNPTADDFRKLKSQVSIYRRIYEDKYRDLRHKVYAHKVLLKPEDVEALYAKTNIREMEELVIFLNRLYNALWQLFYNGIEPVLRPMESSTDVIIKGEIPKWKSSDIHKEIIFETVKFFEVLSRVSKSQP